MKVVACLVLSIVAASPMVVGCCPPEPTKPTTAKVEPRPAHQNLARPEETHFKDLRQLTYGGDNAEAYWAFGGDRLIMQTNHAPYKCDQIEQLDVATGKTTLVSTGKGRTTCSYFLKGDQEIVYASTHASSPECPTPPDMSKGYLWGLFDYDIYRANADGSNLRKLTDQPGYDAEATVCPVDGSIVFTSTRSGDLELWRMDADGKNLRQLTSLPGYDGGAFFSADCSKIVWRSSRPTGDELVAYQELLKQNLVKPTKMDLWVANADGTDARQVTYLPGASFAPYFFPDGKRIIFASNHLAPRGPEFDLFAIDIDGSHLERITYAGGFDGFPVFSPDGKTLSFSSNRMDVVSKPGAAQVYRMTGQPAGPHDTNVFVTEWIDDVRSTTTATPPPRPSMDQTAEADAFAAIVGYLADDTREGRAVGSQGLADATATLQKQLEAWGLEPGNAGAWRQTFEVTTKVERGAATALALDGKSVAPADFTPVASSASTTVSGAIVAAGWGIVDVDAKLDDYQGVRAKGKIVLVHRFVPPKASLDPQTTARLGDLRYKAFIARGKGAIGMIVVDDGDATQDDAPLPPLAAAETEAGIPIVVVTRPVGATLRKGVHQAKLAVALAPVRTKTDNLVALIKSGAAAKQPGVLVIGAHLDHLGMGGPSALDKAPGIHNGADDNASGVAGLMQVARALHAQRATLARDVYIVGFSGEEMGDLGSEYFTKHLPTQEPIVAMLNMDMIGRMRNNQLSVNGGGTATEWKALVEPACQAARVSCTIGGSGYGPSDHMPFYIGGAPVLFFFTGSHADYHTVTDDAAKINAIGGAQVARVVTAVALATANRVGGLTYVKTKPEV
ncbi:MAG: M20/M25/M40 family metallo-hydrolase, partial [Proteobacteria bacterium]|nr:M20/M25/M40 family metallo-hydrolase [Pseudomonadota bacterium]